MLFRSLVQLLAFTELASIVAASPIQGVGGDYTSSSETTDVSDEDRYNQADAALYFEDYNADVALRNVSTQGSDEKPREVREGGIAPVGTVQNATGGGRPFLQSGGPSDYTSTSLEEVSSGDVPTARMTKRKLAQQLRVNGVTWPVTTENNLTLTPILRWSREDMRQLCLRAKKNGTDRYATDDDWYVPSGIYSYSYKHLELAMRAYGDARDQPGHLHWADFAILADWVYYHTINKPFPKSYVGNIASGDNSTIWADFAVNWRSEETYTDGQFKHVFTGEPNATIVAACEAEDAANNNNGGKRKRGIGAGTSPSPVSLSKVLGKRGKFACPPVLDGQTPEEWVASFKPLFMQVARTGFQLALYHGTKKLKHFATQTLLSEASMGMYFEQMTAITHQNAKYRDGPSAFGPYFLEGHYLPPWFSRWGEFGIRFRFAREWAALPESLQEVFTTMNDWMEPFLEATKDVVGQTFQSVYGEIRNPAGETVGWISMGQDLVEAAGAVLVEQPGGEAVVGKFLGYHDEL